MSLAASAGMPVPEVLVVDQGSELFGSAGMIMVRVPGEARGKRIQTDVDLVSARSVLISQLGSAIAGLHSIDPDRLPAASEPDPLGSIRDLIDLFAEPVATFEFALRWLDGHRPPSRAPVIVHGDFRLGNLLVTERGLSAVLDWELVHLGDPVEDLGWCCVRAWRFGASLDVGGLGTRAELLDAYAAAGGDRVSLDDLHWWEVYGTLRWGVICLTQAAAHLQGFVRSVELAAIGRRVAETEWDLLRLLVPESASAALVRSHGGTLGGVKAASVPGLHGRPTSVELLEAVREFLAHEVVGQTEGSLEYHARVAANVVSIVGREIERGSAPLHRRALALAGLGVADEQELCTALRHGECDPDDPAVATVVADGALERLSVSNPSYAHR